MTRDLTPQGALGLIASPGAAVERNSIYYIVLCLRNRPRQDLSDPGMLSQVQNSVSSTSSVSQNIQPLTMESKAIVLRHINGQKGEVYYP
jgi:hypothetical protein